MQDKLHTQRAFRIRFFLLRRPGFQLHPQTLWLTTTKSITYQVWNISEASHFDSLYRFNFPGENTWFQRFSIQPINRNRSRLTCIASRTRVLLSHFRYQILHVLITPLHPKSQAMCATILLKLPRAVGGRIFHFVVRAFHSDCFIWFLFTWDALPST